MHLNLSRKQTLTLSIACIVLIGLTAWGRHHFQQQRQLHRELDQLRYQVTTGDIRVEVKVKAEATLVDEQNLSFGQEGKVTAVNVRVGDYVQAGDVLAELDMTDYHAAVEAAQLELDSALLALDQLYNNDISLREQQLRTQIRQLEADLHTYQDEYTTLTQRLEDTYQQKTSHLAQAERELSIATQDLALMQSGVHISSTSETEITANTLQQRDQTIDAIISDLQAIIVEIELIVESVDQIFGMSDIFHDQAEPYLPSLSARSTQLKKATNDHLRDAYKMIDQYTERISAISPSMSDQEITSLIEQIYTDSQSLIILLDSAQDALDMTYVTPKLSTSQLSSFNSTISSARTQTTTLRTQLQSYLSSLRTLLSAELQTSQRDLRIDQEQLSVTKQENLVEQLQEQVDLLDREISTLRIDQSTQRTAKQTQIDNTQHTISLTQAELQDLLDGADPYDIQQQQNLIEQAKLNLQTTTNQQDDYQIIADFEGRVRTVEITEGEQYKLDDRQYIVVENPSLIELNLQVSQIDIVKIKPGDPVIVTFDAYPLSPLDATITSRNVNPQPNGRGGYYYEATILLEKQQLEILAGMSALVTVTPQHATDVVVVPTMSLFQRDGHRYVYREVDREFTPQRVEVGIMNNFEAEITTGLTIGETIRSSVIDEEQFDTMGINDSSSSLFGG